MKQEAYQRISGVGQSQCQRSKAITDTWTKPDLRAVGRSSLWKHRDSRTDPRLKRLYKRPRNKKRVTDCQDQSADSQGPGAPCVWKSSARCGVRAPAGLGWRAHGTAFGRTAAEEAAPGLWCQHWTRLYYWDTAASQHTQGYIPASQLGSLAQHFKRTPCLLIFLQFPEAMQGGGSWTHQSLHPHL